MDYKITKINADGTVTVTFSSKTLTVPAARATQTLDTAPLDSAASLTTYLADYTRSFAEGLQSEKDDASQTTGLPAEVTALVNKTQTVDLTPPTAAV